MYRSESLIYRPTAQDPHAGLLSQLSPLQAERSKWDPELPAVLRDPVEARAVNVSESNESQETQKVLESLFPKTAHQPNVELVPASDLKRWSNHPPLRLGVVLSGGQAPGGHNVIAGLFDFAMQCNSNSQVFGFLGGPSGVYESRYLQISSEQMNKFRNSGGFHMIQSGRHKIETFEHKQAALQVCEKLALHGLVIIGGDDSNTNAAILAEHFRQQGSTISVIGVPKTIDGDLKNDHVEISFGFDTATKVYSELIGNLMTDVSTSRNRYHFVRLMGRSASNIALECALQTRPNLCFIGEEIMTEKRSLNSMVQEIVDLVTARHQLNKNFGVFLIPEGLIEFIPEMGVLIKELNDILSTNAKFDASQLSSASQKVFFDLPEAIRKTLLLERDPHGNVQVAKIATEKLLITMTQARLKDTEMSNVFKATAHYFGYEGRCAMPSQFDAQYCYALGHTAGALIDQGLTGYMACVSGLSAPVIDWKCGGTSLQAMMTIERRKGKERPVIKKYLVDLEKPLFKMFAEVREHWKLEDFYRNPGPVQFEGPSASALNYLIKLPTRNDLLPPLPFNVESLRQRYDFIKSEAYMSPLQIERLHTKIEVPTALINPHAHFVAGPKCSIYDQLGTKFVNRAFPMQCKSHKMKMYNVLDKSSANFFQPNTNVKRDSSLDGNQQPRCDSLRIGVVLQGQQAPGSCNVLHGIFARLQLRAPKSQLIGFKGITGLLEQHYLTLGKEDLKLYFNQGGFELLGRTKHTKPMVRTDAGLQKIMHTCQQLNLDGLIMIGGQTSLTDAALVTEYFLENGCNTSVIGVPATQENNLRHSLIEACIGFDSTSKCYSSLVGNLLIDAASATKYWYFVRLMGQAPSHMVLEAALQTHPNMCIISEKYAESDRSLFDVVDDIANVVCARAEAGKDFGTVLIPEGLVSQLPYLKQLFSQLNALLSTVSENDYQNAHSELVHCEESLDSSLYLKKLDPWVLAVWKSLPSFFREQFIQQSGVEFAELSIEQLLSQMVAAELDRRKLSGAYKGTFSPVCHYLGFQGRSTMPSEFDCRLGLAYGYLACMAVEAKLTGYVTSIHGLCGHFSTWRLSAVPITAVMKVMPDRETKAYGRNVPMVPCAEVNLDGKAYQALRNVEEQWEVDDCYCNPGPIQFNGRVAKFYNRTLYEEQYEYLKMLRQLESLTNYIETFCTFGIDENVLKTAVLSLEGLKQILHHTHGSSKDSMHLT